MYKAETFNVLLVEPANLLRRTVSLTVRSLGTAEVTEAANYATAYQACEVRRFDGAIVAIDWSTANDESEGLMLIQRIRTGQCAVQPAAPIAVLVEACDVELLQTLRASKISRILIKPFRARDVIDTINAMKSQMTVPTVG